MASSAGSGAPPPSCRSAPTPPSDVPTESLPADGDASSARPAARSKADSAMHWLCSDVNRFTASAIRGHRVEQLVEGLPAVGVPDRRPDLLDDRPAGRERCDDQQPSVALGELPPSRPGRAVYQLVARSSLVICSVLQPAREIGSGKAEGPHWPPGRITARPGLRNGEVDRAKMP